MSGLADVPVEPFRWRDGEREIRFGGDALDGVDELLGDGYALLTTERALQSAPQLATHAAVVHLVPTGLVDELAGALRDEVEGELLVALGGGRVIDVAKALAAADPPRRVAAIPTTLSAAEMTALHRHAAGVKDVAGVRPAIVLNDPALSASAPEPALAASAANALAHAVEAPVTTLANPAASLVAGVGARLLTRGIADGGVDRDALALGALLSGYAMGSALYGLHHVLAQTLVREAGVGHGQANAVLLPHTIPALARRRPAAIEQLDVAVDGGLAEHARRLAARAESRRLRDLGVPRERLETCADAVARRAELELTPPRAERAELLEIYERAW